MTSTSTVPLDAAISSDRGKTPLGGFNFTALRLEVTRVLRNRRTLFFILVFPSIFFYLFGLSNKQLAKGPNAGVILAYIMISMAVYGAMVGNTSGGASVAVERSLGWSRQLRLTPLHPLAYVTMKVLTSMTLGLIAVLGVFVFGAVNGVHMEPSMWLYTALSAWGSSFVFAAFGLFVGFLFPAENVMQFVGPLMAVMAMFGGIFIPLQQLPQGLQNFAKWTPMFGVGQLARAPLVGGATAWAAGNLVTWTILFAAGAMVLFRRDTARV